MTYVKTPICFGTVLKLKKYSFWKSIWKVTGLAPFGKESFWHPKVQVQVKRFFLSWKNNSWTALAV